MKTTRLSLIVLALTAASTSMAWATDAAAPKTRAQVQAELVDAQRNGTLIADGQTGATFRELNPGRYMQPATVSPVTRAQVKAELAAARRNGTLIADGQTGATFRDLAPHRFPAQADMQARASGAVHVMSQNTTPITAN
jgi:lipoprotein-anchoring transpeptidase ErfK/SrfK